ncbi:MAG: hypothetical protein J0H81_13650 [Sphingopyxis terrae]|nr:hypothetical protein [Sphingopyxis terrae]
MSERVSPWRVGEDDEAQACHLFSEDIDGVECPGNFMRGLLFALPLSLLLWVGIAALWWWLA